MFGLIVAFAVVWWAVFFAVLPFGVRRQEDIQVGTDPGAPANPMMWRKVGITTLIAFVLVGGAYAADATGLVDLRSLIFGLDPACVDCESGS